LALAVFGVTRTAATVRASATGTAAAAARERLPRVVGFLFALGMALAPMAAPAQTPAPASGSDLLQPSLQGNPNNPPRFRRPGEAASSRDDQAPPPGAFTANSRIAATPIYGSPTGFGAGNTGFDSSNARRRTRRRQQQQQQQLQQQQTKPIGSEVAPGQQPETTFTPVPTLTPPPPPKPPAPKKRPPPEVHPAKAASRTGATLPPPSEARPVSNPPPEVYPLKAANRHGGAVPVPPSQDTDIDELAPPPAVTPLLATSPIATPSPTAPPPSTLPLGMQPFRPLPVGEGDPYAALGIRAGSFILLPSLDLAGGYSTNPEHGPGSQPAAAYFVGGPELQVASDWERHALTADIIGTYTQYGETLVPSLNVPYFSSKVDGRVDVLHDTQIVLENRFLLTTDNPGSPNLQAQNLPAQLAKLPIDTDIGGTLGLVHEFNRLSVAVLGTFDRAVYYDSLLTDGQEASNADRNFDQTAGILRVGYDLDPGLKPFLQVQEDERIHDLQFDRNGLQRDSVGTTALAGADVDMFGSLIGEMAGGWVIRTYKDPTLPDVSGAIGSGSLIWQATPLTTAKVGLSSQVYETIVAGASGQFTHDVTFEVDHAFLRWLTGIVTAGYGTDDYVGSPLRDSRYFVSAGLIYKLSREIQIRAIVRQDWQIATESTFSYMATSVLLGLH
jgi:hypothetical protein